MKRLATGATFSFLLSVTLFASEIEIRDPVTVHVDVRAARTWSSFDLPPGAAGPATAITFDSEPPAGRARIDVFHRESGRWRFLAAAQLSGNRTAVLPRGTRVAALLRFEEMPHVYGWLDSDSAGDHETVRLLRTIEVAPPPGDDTAAVLFSEEPMPLQVRDGAIRGAPLSAGLLCVGGACATVTSHGDRASLPPHIDTRVARIHAPAPHRIAVRAPGRTPLSPVPVPATITRAGAWAAVALPDGVQWRDVSVDVSSGRPLARVAGGALAPLPDSTQIHSQGEKGLVVRPLIGPEKRPHPDAEATVYVFTPGESSGVPAIPLASARLEDGVFRLAELGAGSYSLKLFSPEASGEPVIASLQPGVPADVVFGRGPVVTGRVVRSTGGSPDELVAVEIIRQTPVGADHAGVVDWLRAGTAGVDGTFRVMLTMPGPYRLRARWGTAYAEVDFMVKDLRKDIDLGELQLRSGATVRGTLPGCKDGELRAAFVPDVTNARTVPFFDYRRIPVGPDGDVFAEGLTAGQWTVDARCAGATTGITPAIIEVPESGVLFVEFRLVQ